jgi:cytochrome c
MKQYLVLAACAAGLTVITARAQQQTQAPARFGFGRPATAAEIAAWDIDVGPDGKGLPPGRGTPAEGAATYAAKCASCHGKTGKEGPNDVLVGREPRGVFPSGKEAEARRTIGNYWPYATTVFDYIRRAMPAPTPGSLTDNEVYGLVAFLLEANEIIPSGTVMDATSLPKVAMPARDKFVIDSRGGPKAKTALPEPR